MSRLPPEMTNEILLYLPVEEIIHRGIRDRFLWSELLWRDFGLRDQNPYERYLLELPYRDAEEYRNKIISAITRPEARNPELLVNERLRELEIHSNVFYSSATNEDGINQWDLLYEMSKLNPFGPLPRIESMEFYDLEGDGKGLRIILE